MYDLDDFTGFQVLDHDYRPVLLESPVPAIAVAIVAHADDTTHGISPGVPMVDHFEVVSFMLPTAD